MKTRSPAPVSAPPAGSVDAADDLLLDMEREPPDEDEEVFDFTSPDGEMKVHPARSLPKSEW